MIYMSSPLMKTYTYYSSKVESTVCPCASTYIDISYNVQIFIFPVNYSLQLIGPESYD